MSTLETSMSNCRNNNPFSNGSFSTPVRTSRSITDVIPEREEEVQTFSTPNAPMLQPLMRSPVLTLNRHILNEMSPGDLRAAVQQLQQEKVRLEDDLRILKVENSSLQKVLRFRSSSRTCSQTPSITSTGIATRTTTRHLLATCSETSRPSATAAIEIQSLNSSSASIDECGDRNGRNCSTISVVLSQSMTVLSQINNPEMIDKVCAGTVIARQIGIGSVAGYAASHLVRKFGKLAVGSIIGSMCVLKYAHQTGYISVNWGRIRTQIESSVDENNNAKDGNAVFSFFKKIHEAKKWSRENRYVVLGFWAGFLAHNLQ